MMLPVATCRGQCRILVASSCCNLYTLHESWNMWHTITRCANWSSDVCYCICLRFVTCMCTVQHLAVLWNCTWAGMVICCRSSIHRTVSAVWCICCGCWRYNWSLQLLWWSVNCQWFWHNLLLVRILSAVDGELDAEPFTTEVETDGCIPSELAVCRLS